MKKNLPLIALLFGALAIMIALTGCGKSNPAAAPTHLYPYIWGYVFNKPAGMPASMAANYDASVQVGDSIGNFYTNATVTINSTPLTLAGGGAYYGTVNTASGTTYSLSVSVPGDLDSPHTASVTQFTNYPSIILPAANSTWQAANTNVVTWSKASPETGTGGYTVSVYDTATGNQLYASGTAWGVTTHTIPANKLGTGNCIVLVEAKTSVTIPNTSPLFAFLPSRFEALGYSGAVAVTIQ